VPLSEDELRLKIRAIFKHQSQKDKAPFPGLDDREFWQRVEDRNQATAAQIDRLGLPEYFAMESYVVRKHGERIEQELVPTSALAREPRGRWAPDGGTPAPGGAESGELGGRLVEEGVAR
jgi:glucosamine-6-phosphate deaminase